MMRLGPQHQRRRRRRRRRRGQQGASAIRGRARKGR
jgi:hypothetical protein